MARAGETSSHLTPHLLKSRTGEFDLESISFLDLSGMGLYDISCISECMGLLHLELANNKLYNLDDLGELKLLETLNVSCNNLSSLDGVEDLTNLSSLNVAGNMIRSVDSLSCLRKLENLKSLRLQDSIQNLSNPVCASEENYKKAVCNLLPKLKTLDEHDLDSAHGVALKTVPWNTEKLLCSNNSLDRSVEEAEKGFKDVMLQCKKINEDADKAINNATQALWNS